MPQSKVVKQSRFQDTYDYTTQMNCCVCHKEFHKGDLVTCNELFKVGRINPPDAHHSEPSWNIYSSNTNWMHESCVQVDFEIGPVKL